MRSQQRNRHKGSSATCPSKSTDTLTEKEDSMPRCYPRKKNRTVWITAPQNAVPTPTQTMPYRRRLLADSPKSDREGLENQAIDLLEAATEILASSSSRSGLPPRPFDGSGAERRAACEANSQKHSKDFLRKRQVRSRCVETRQYSEASSASSDQSKITQGKNRAKLSARSSTL